MFRARYGASVRRHELADDPVLLTTPALWRIHSDRVNARLLDRWLPDDHDRILKTDLYDESVSPGLYPELARRGGTVVGMDISSSTAAASHDRHPGLRAVVADIRRLPFRDGTFDAIVSNSTLDHLATSAEIEAGLEDLFRVLRGRGHLVVTLDNLANPVVAVRNWFPSRWLQRLHVVPYPIGRTWRPRRLRRSLEDAGFDVLDVDAILHFPRAVMVWIGCALDRRTSATTRQRLLDLSLGFEGLRRWPTRFLTGYFVAARARKPG